MLNFTYGNVNFNFPFQYTISSRGKMRIIARKGVSGATTFFPRRQDMYSLPLNDSLPRLPAEKANWNANAAIKLLRKQFLVS